MNDHTENRGKYPGLSQLSTPELEELLRRDFTASGEDGPDLDAVLAIMEVINSREEEEIPEADVDAAWAAFRENVIEASPAETNLEETSEPAVVPFAKPKENTRKPKKFRWAVSVAAVVCVMVGVLAVPASGNPALENLVQWTSEHFSFLPQDKPPQERPGAVSYEQLEEMVGEITDLPVLPSWYPDGCTLERVEENRATLYHCVLAVFSVDGEELSICVTSYREMPADFGVYEKNEGIVELYYAGGIAHYVMSNTEHNVVAWVNQNIECSIQGMLSVEELREIVDSIYKEIF